MHIKPSSYKNKYAHFKLWMREQILNTKLSSHNVTYFLALKLGDVPIRKECMSLAQFLDPITNWLWQVVPAYLIVSKTNLTSFSHLVLAHPFIGRRYSDQDINLIPSLLSWDDHVLIISFFSNCFPTFSIELQLTIVSQL